jgi:hypothetical protein
VDCEAAATSSALGFREKECVAKGKTAPATTPFYRRRGGWCRVELQAHPMLTSPRRSD